MADWIKMRSSLMTNPKVIRMARVLCCDAEFMAWFAPGRQPAETCDDVTDRDVLVVTRVTVGGLLPTWSSVTDSAGSDGKLRHATSRDVDLMAGIPGFGRAMQAVEWMRVLPDGQGIHFVHFDEFNSVQKERSLTAKSGAERTKEYRERRKQATQQAPGGDAQGDDVGDVTVTSQRDDREEKRREEKSNTPHKPPKGATSPVGLMAWLQSVKAKGEKPVPDTDTVFAYADEVGIPRDFLRLAWLEFRHRYTQPDAKRYRDWRAVFRKAVRGNWLKLWWLDGQVYALTTAGVQAQRAHQPKEAA